MKQVREKEMSKKMHISLALVTKWIAIPVTETGVMGSVIQFIYLRSFHKIVQWRWLVDS